MKENSILVLAEIATSIGKRHQITIWMHLQALKFLPTQIKIWRRALVVAIPKPNKLLGYSIRVIDLSRWFVSPSRS